MALASQRNRLRYGFVVTDKTECQKPQAIEACGFFIAVPQASSLSVAARRSH